MKVATIKDVAKKAGVSICTVSYVLNDTPGQSIPEATRQKVINAVKELDYTPNANARGIKMKKSMAIGLVSFWDVTNPAFNEVLTGVSNIADENDYAVLFCNLRSEKKKNSYVGFFKRQQIDGVVFLSPNEPITGFNEEEHVDLMYKNRIPAVILNGSGKNEIPGYIYIDYYGASYAAAEYLISLGHKKIGYLLPQRSELESFQAQERMRGFNECLTEHGIEKVDKYIFTNHEFETVIKMVRDGVGPTGIVANKVSYARQFMEYVLNSGGVHIPGDISIVAANSEPYAQYLCPPLSAVQLPLREMGERGTQILLEYINKKTVTQKLTLPNKIVERKSCRRIE